MDPFDMIGEQPNEYEQPQQVPDQYDYAFEYPYEQQSYPIEQEQITYPTESTNLLDDLFDAAPYEYQSADYTGEYAENAAQPAYEDGMDDFLGAADVYNEEQKDVFYEMPYEAVEQMPEDITNPQKVAEIQSKNEAHLGALYHEQEEQKLGLKREGDEYRTDCTKKHQDAVKERIEYQKEEQKQNDEFIKGKGKKWLKVKKLMGELPKGRVGDVLKDKFEDEVEEEQSEK